MSDPSKVSRAYAAMAEKWALPQSLMGGTPAMKAAGVRYLPRHPAENATVYAERARRAVLRNYFRRTVQKITGRLFSHPIVASTAVAPRLLDYLQNTDLAGQGLNSFAKSWFEDALVCGISYVLVDYPTAANFDDVMRPYAVPIRAENLIWASADEASLQPRLAQIRIREQHRETKGFDEVINDQIRIITPDEWQVHRKIDGKNWQKVAAGENSLGEVPLVALYTNRTGFMQASPPLEDLAYLNLEHYQIRSDQRNALNVASFPILAASGYEAEVDGPIEVGPNKVLTTSDTGGKYYYVESSGAALEAGARELKDLEKAIQLFGLQFEAHTASETATGRRLDAADAMSPVTGMIMEIEDSLNDMLRLFAKWEGIDAGGVLSLKIAPDELEGRAKEADQHVKDRQEFNAPAAN